ncbi:MAG: nucleotidyl transferase AbiEii/AbiGii toxin family protein [Dysgonamonadaceae bacterium]|jgi:predicted nucleotidyltransferase component of viral defense system|nr:nucleotidyl transferase AbiEii/AbiGii toxin family protein [Dysgonamonadaceae bacterium]
MDKWQNIDDNRRIFIIENIAEKTKLSPDAVEKDWWVTMTLKALFSCECTDHIVFKGGTSLSKAWNLIERFSEDIDIAIDRKFFGFDGELKKKQINNLRRASCAYISGQLKEELDNKLKYNGIEGYSLSVPETQDTTKDPQTIEIIYNSLFTSSYIRDKVIIEIGARSLIEPSENVQIRSIIADNFPDTDFADTYFAVPTVIPQRTFLEKAFLLHEEFQKPFDKIRIDRMTRHIYDLEKLMDTNFATEALNSKELYNAIVEHRRTLTAMKEVDYSTHSPQTINFVPPDFVMNEWRTDYEKMKNMIYGESLPFDKLIERIKELNERFRKIEI